MRPDTPQGRQTDDLLPDFGTHRVNRTDLVDDERAIFYVVAVPPVFRNLFGDQPAS